MPKVAENYQWNSPKTNIETYEYAEFSGSQKDSSLQDTNNTDAIANEEVSFQENSGVSTSDLLFDEEWFKTYTFFEQSGTGHALEFIWYDDGSIDIAIDGLTIDSFDSKSYVFNDEGGISYSCTKFDVCYYPNDRNSVQISKGMYSGYYYPQ